MPDFRLKPEHKTSKKIEKLLDFLHENKLKIRVENHGVCFFDEESAFPDKPVWMFDGEKAPTAYGNPVDELPYPLEYQFIVERD